MKKDSSSREFATFMKVADRHICEARRSSKTATKMLEKTGICTKNGNLKKPYK